MLTQTSVAMFLDPCCPSPALLVFSPEPVPFLPSPSQDTMRPLTAQTSCHGQDPIDHLRWQSPPTPDPGSSRLTPSRFRCQEAGRSQSPSVGTWPSNQPAEPR